MTQEPSSLLDRIRSGREDALDELEDDYDPDGEYRAFSASRLGLRSEVMLDLVFRTGKHESLSYAHLYCLSYDPTDGIVMQFTDHVVSIRGHKLKDLYRYLRSHRVIFICEADSPTSKLLATNEAIVNAIAVEGKVGI
jgi:hypothetical protein